MTWVWMARGATTATVVQDTSPIWVAIITAAAGIVVAVITTRRNRTAPSPPPTTTDTDVVQSVQLKVLEQNVATHDHEIRDHEARLRALEERSERRRRDPRG